MQPTKIKLPSKKELIKSSKKRPIKTAGIIEIKIDIEKFLDSLSLESNKPKIIFKISFLKKNSVLKAVAKCSTIVKSRLSLLERSFPNIAFDISRCPLEDIGKNSVKP
jgi:hypothetical protein